MKIGEFFVELFVKAEAGQLTVKSLIGAFGELNAATVAEAGALGELAFKFAGLAEQAYNAAAAFQMFESETGLSSQELQKWQIVAEQANVSSESVAGGITALQRQLAEIRLGRGNVAPFQLLGISANQDAFAVLDQLRDRIKGLDNATATNLISQMGLSPDMIHILQLSNNEFDKLAKTQRGMTEAQEHQFLSGKLALVQFSQAIKYAGYQIVDAFGPTFIEILKTGTFWINQGAAAIGFVVSHLGDLKGALAAIAIVLAPLFVETFPITAALVALMLVLDDLATYFRGGKSVTGEAIEGLKALGKALEDAFPAGASAALDKLTSVFKVGMNPFAGVMGQAQAAVAGAVTQNVNINVHSSAPPHEVGKAIKKELDRGISAAQLQTNNQGY